MQDAQLIQEEIVHHHTESCYAETPVTERQLICTLPEHVHSDSCYAEEKVLICDKPELHTHTEACYEKGPNGETPEEMGWIHYEEKDGQRVLVGDPTHRICGKNELLEHVHTDACFHVEGNTAEDGLTDGDASDGNASEGNVAEENTTEDHTSEENASAAKPITDKVLKDVNADDEEDSSTSGDPQKKADEADMPAQDFHAETATMSVSVTAEAGTFPAGTTMRVEDVEDTNVLDSIRDASAANNSQIVKVNAVDITFYTAEGEEIEPEKPVSVIMKPLEDVPDVTEEGTGVEVIHVSADGEAVVVGQKSEEAQVAAADEVTFEAESFSVYALVYTVDFHYEVNGKEFDFSIPGGGFVSFYNLVKVLGIEVNETATEKDEIQELVDGVESITFSTPQLVSVSKVEDDTTVGALKDRLGLECEYSAELTEKQIAEINAQEVNAGDWALISMQPFDSVETMNVIMKNGEVFTVKVTDAQITTMYLSDSGDTYEVTVTYGLDAEIPENAHLDVTAFDSESVEYAEAKELIVKEKKAIDENYNEEELGFAALDISIVGEDGAVIEPAEGSDVTVSIRLISLPDIEDKNEFINSLEIQHLNLVENEIKVEKVATSDNITVKEGLVEAKFVTESFSTYTISWRTATGGGLNGVRISQTTSGSQYIIYAKDATDGNYYAIQHDGTSVKVASSDGIPTYTGNQNDLKWYVRLQNGSYDFYYGSYNSRRYLNAGTIGTGINIAANDSTTWSQWSNYIFSAGDTFLQSYNSGTYRVRNVRGEGGWENNSLIYFSTGFTQPTYESKEITVHYGTMSGNEFVEFDALPEGAQNEYGGPTMIGDQLNVRYDISGKDYVTTRINDPLSGTQISPLLQTESTSYSYWKYRILNTLTVNDGINPWQPFGANENDIYVIYRDTPTQKSYDDGGLTAEDLVAPATNKDVQPNGDGTYDVSLSVTGTSNSKKNKTHANVVIVLDTSSSMNRTDIESTGETIPNEENRLIVAKRAIKTLASQLFGFNSTEDPAAVEVAFVDFSHRVRNEMTKDTIYSGVVNGSGYNNFISLVNGLNTNGGTNYDTAIEAANSVLWNDADPVYVIFVTDGDTVSRGYLAYDSTGATDHAADWDGGTYYNGDSTQTIEQYYARARSAAKIQLNKLLADGNNKFYSIGVFGTVSYLQDLGGIYLGQANDQDTIEQAFSTIIGDLSLELGYEGVTIHDGITALTSTALVNGVADQFRYKITKKDGTVETFNSDEVLQTAYPGIGTATYDSTEKQVQWNLGTGYQLEDGWTYSVSFTVWPRQ